MASADWLGSVVSIYCGPTLGVYQGSVSSVDQSKQTISLREAYHNGVRCAVPEVTFNAMDIKELKFLDESRANRTNDDSQPATTEPGPSYSVPAGQSSRTTANNTPSAPVTSQRKGSSTGRGTTAQAMAKKNGTRNGGGAHARPKNYECFGDAVFEDLDEDFDFEANLALFDKAAVFSEIDEADQISNGVRPRSTPSERTPARYRHDENILAGKPVVYRQITVPHHRGKEYCTDSGLVVPSVSYELHKRMLAAAERHGLSQERRLEMTGVCASQMALTLLGGPNRLTPKNVHQKPTVALLCGPHIQGAQGISCGRHLANREVEVILFLPNYIKIQDPVTSELSLFSQTSGKQVSNVKDLPSSPVDLIINCLDCHENPLLREQSWYQTAAEWANTNRTPVLSIDPPPDGEQQPAVQAKWTLSLGLPLPLPAGEGRVYLCDIGIPKLVFQEVGIDYHSPFASKFVIPLHSA